MSFNTKYSFNLSNRLYFVFLPKIPYSVIAILSKSPFSSKIFHLEVDVCLYFCPNNTDDIKLQKTGVEEECEELFVGDRNYSIKVRVLCTKHLGDSLEQNKNVSEIQEGQELKNVQ